jgi:hypothetical protein
LFFFVFFFFFSVPRVQATDNPRERMFGLFQLLISIVLFVNSVAILHEERFLRPMGWGYGDQFPGQSGIKDKVRREKCM